MSKTLHPKFKTILKIFIMAVVLGLAALLGHHLGDEITLIDAWIRDQGPWAPFFFTLAFCLLPLIAFPTDVLCFSAGALFGLWQGLLFAVIGMLVSAGLMFIIARYLAHGKLQKIFAKHRRFEAIEKAVSKGGTKIPLLLRFMPIPFAPLSYFLGVTNIKFKVYFLTVFGTSTSVFLGVYYGYVAQHVTQLAGKTAEVSALHEILVWSGLILLLLGVILIARWARRVLRVYEVA